MTHKTIINNLIAVDGCAGAGKGTLLSTLHAMVDKCSHLGVQSEEYIHPGVYPSYLNDYYVQYRNLFKQHPLKDDVSKVFSVTALLQEIFSIASTQDKTNVLQTCDRYTASTHIYQGVVGNATLQKVMQIEECLDYKPFSIILITCSWDLLEARLKNRLSNASAEKANSDVFKTDWDYLYKIYSNYEMMAYNTEEYYRSNGWEGSIPVYDVIQNEDATPHELAIKFLRVVLANYTKAGLEDNAYFISRIIEENS